ncbi:MAG TPA: metal ABC transporter permease [Trueperaceae bacterium]|nr:metal ABC transporter permease [Trueperaceae bacterium]
MLSFLLDPIVVTVTLGAALLGLAAGSLGTFAVLRRESLIGDTMSHAALPGVAIGFLLAGERSLPAMLAGAVVTGLAAALFSLYLSTLQRIKRDAAMGVALGLFFAFGVVALSYAQKRPGAAAAGLETFLFGQAAATLRSDLWLLGAVTLIALGVVVLLWKQVKAVTFDPGFAQAAGIDRRLYEAVLTGLLAVAIVIGLQMVGVVLMSALVVAPAVAARQWSGNLGTMFWLAGAIGSLSAVTGALISAQVSGLATGPLVVLVATAAVIFSLLAAPRRSVKVEG